MPKYEYACKSCGERLEVVQSFTDEPLTECAACGGVLRKVFSPPSISFKGSGFYRNDNRGGRPSESDSKSDSKSDQKSDSKPDSKSDSSGSKSGDSSKPAKTAPATPSGSKPAPKAAEAKSA